MRARAKNPGGGFTLVELVVATGLASILLVALFRLLDVTLDLWAKGETRRGLVERASGTVELLAADLRALHSGAGGDLLCEWVPFDADGDGRVDRFWPRLRLVRDAAPEDLVRLAADDLDPALLAEAAQQGVDPLSLALTSGVAPPTPVEAGVVQVAWAVVPAARTQDGRAEGLLVRGEQRVTALNPGDVFEPGFFGRTGEPRVGATREVTGGVLWLGFAFASQTTVLWDGWNLGGQLADASTAWDAWGRARLDTEAHAWNDPPPGLPAAVDRPVLPRRVRLELEFETARERERRPRLALPVDKGDSTLALDGSDDLPTGAGRHVLVDAEWMEVVRASAGQLGVRRGARGTQATQHEPGALVHWGEPVVSEVPIPAHFDDWNLAGRR